MSETNPTKVKTSIKTRSRQTWYRLKNDYLKTSNILTIAGIIIGGVFVYSSISTLYKNYAAEKRVEEKLRERTIAELQAATLEYERNYYQSKEYQELAARERLGLAAEGENLLVLPKNPEETTSWENPVISNPESDTSEREPESNFYQWMQFLFGGNSK